MKNPNLAKAFKVALKHLSPTRYDTSGKREYICHAIGDAYGDGKISYEQQKEAKRLILDRLQGDSDMFYWVADRVGKGHLHDDSNHNKGRKLQATRRAWLKSLIKEFS